MSTRKPRTISPAAAPKQLLATPLHLWPGTDYRWLEPGERLAPIPPGFVKCGDCGEYNGATEARYLAWKGQSMWSPEAAVTVRCLCRGSLCRTCKRNRIHASGSNSYHEAANKIGHWFYLADLIPCGERKRGSRSLSRSCRLETRSQGVT